MADSYFSLSAASRPEIRRSMSELKNLEATLDEIEARGSTRHKPKAKADPGASLVATDFDPEAIWRNRRAGKGTPTRASTLGPVALDEGEITRRIRRNA